MELRTMRCFLAVAREEDMTRAAELLHVTQPTLSKQLKALEDELGKKLFTRHSFSIQLTREGILLRKRWDVVMPEDCLLAEKDTICADDLIGLPLFYSEQGWKNDISKWCGNSMDQLHLEGIFCLIMVHFLLKRGSPVIPVTRFCTDSGIK